MPDCCNSVAESPRPPACPRCGEVGHEVGRETVGAMAGLGVPAITLSRPAFRFCEQRACPVVYYAGRAVVERTMVRVPVHEKDARLDVPLCYCFGHTRRSISAETRATGRSRASATIAAEVRAGNCACDIKNPSGQCCLGDVRAFEKRAGEMAEVAGQAEREEGR